MRARGLAALVAVGALTLTACNGDALNGASEQVGSAPVSAASDVAAPTGDAAEALAALEVKGRAPKTGYDRDEFGPAWKDVDGNGCGTRDDILTRDLSEVRTEDGCVVLSGVLEVDPYTGERLEFTRGASVIDIDHVVALSNAWQTGAFQWDADKRLAIANDPLNLLAVDAPANRQKGDGDAATWLPSNKSFRCAYVARQIAVKASYGLWVTKAEKQAMERVLSTCPGQPLPTRDDTPTATPGSDTDTTTTNTDTDKGTGKGTPTKGAVRYANCADARDAGKAPIVKKKNPNLYAANKHLDGDKDGRACE